VQATGRRIGEGWCRRQQSNKRGGGDLQRESGVRVFSHRQSGPVPAFLSSGVPEHTPGSQGLPGLSGWIKALFWGKRGTGGAAGLNYAVRMEKKGIRGPHRGDGWRCSKLCMVSMEGLPRIYLGLPCKL
jgi:hypothetical protein